GLPQNLTWKGDSVSNVWNTTAANWLKGTNVTVFSPGDAILFDASGSASPAINVPGPVSPSAMSVTGSNDYTFTGAGSIGGAMTVVKSGTGTLTFNTTNLFSGGTMINGGKVVMGVPGAIGGGGVTLNGVLQLFGGDFNNTLSLVEQGTLIGSPSANDFLKGAISGEGIWSIDLSSGRVLSQESDLSGFTGQINLLGGGTLRLNQGVFTWGNASAAFDLGAEGTLNNRSTSARTVFLGALSGGTNSRLRASDQATSSSTTYQVGALNLDSVFDGSMQDGGGVPAQLLALTIVGTGTLTLNGTNTATGGIAVNGGALIVNGSAGAGAVNVANATLGGGGGIVGSVGVAAGANLSPGASAGTAGTLTLSNNLTLTGANLRFDLASVTTPGNGVNDLISLNGGTLALNGVSTVLPNYLNGPLASGAYTLISGGTATTGSAANLAWAGITGMRQAFTFDLSTPGSVLLQVSGPPPAALVWQGTNGSNWDLTTTNWLNSGVADKFFNIDPVLFDDTSTNGSVIVAATVEPGAVTVSNTTRAYTLSGGRITGAMALVKSGAGSLTLAASNSFTGGVTIQGGDIFLANDVANQTALGTGPVTLANGTLNMFSSPLTANTAAWNLVVPSTFTGQLNADASCDLSGSLSGGGTFNFFVPATNTTLLGDWSAFTGGINVLTATSGVFRVANLSGYPAAALNLGNNVTASFALDPGADVTVDIGELSGGAASRLRGEAGDSILTWRIGG
ncbi:MAG: autotransporter-associated beta strand repeat-containing protein, partial [Akkermansiaceae bacterium]|nr:autotransporter-associated beta strand repeat-containing protein [Verrucomicrobiales bacterium]